MQVPPLRLSFAAGIKPLPSSIIARHGTQCTHVHQNCATSSEPSQARNRLTETVRLRKLEGVPAKRKKVKDPVKVAIQIERSLLRRAHKVLEHGEISSILRPVLIAAIESREAKKRK